MKRVLILLLMFLLTGCVCSGGEEMYIAIYGRDLNHIANVTDVKYEITERVFDLDTSNFSGITSVDISNGLIFVLYDNSGKQIYSGYIKNINQANNMVTFAGDDFKKTLDTEVILDYATELQTSPAVLGDLFKDVADAVLNQNSEAILIVNPQEDIYWIANYDMQYLTINVIKFLKTYLSYFGYYIYSFFDVVNKKVVLEIKQATETTSIRLADFVHETIRSDTLTNKAIATLKFNNTQEGLMWIGSSKAYWDRQQESNRGVEGPQSFPEPLNDANNYEYGFALKVRYQEQGFPETIDYYYQVSNAAINRPINLPNRAYYLANDNLIYETLIPQDKMILPVITKVFEEEFFQTAQFNAVSELVNSRYNENIIITNSQTPVDISRYDLYTMVKVYDKNGLMFEMPLAEIERSNEVYKIKLGFKKTKFTEIIKSLTEDAPIKSTGASGSGGGGGLSEGAVHNIIDNEVPALIEESKQTGTFPPDPHNHDNRYYTETEVDLKKHLYSRTDERDIDTIPNDYNSKFDIKGLKKNSVIGITDEGTYSGLLGMRGWSDSSGGNAHEFALTQNGNIKHRHGSTEDWNNWRTIAFLEAFGDWVKKENIDINDLPSIPNSKLSGLEGRLDLLSGSIFNYFLDAQNKIYENLIPAVAITDTFEANSQAAMLALTVQKGDICIRTDLNKSYVLAQTPASTLTNWKELRTPTDAVLSVAGKTGAVSLSKNDVGLSNVDNTSDLSKPVSNAAQNALNLKANLTSPALTGNPSAPTQALSNNSTRLASTAFVWGLNGGKREYHVTAQEYANLGVNRDPNGVYNIRGTL